MVSLRVGNLLTTPASISACCNSDKGSRRAVAHELIQVLKRVQLSFDPARNNLLTKEIFDAEKSCSNQILAKIFSKGALFVVHVEIRSGERCVCKNVPNERFLVGAWVSVTRGSSAWGKNILLEAVSNLPICG